MVAGYWYWMRDAHMNVTQIDVVPSGLYKELTRKGFISSAKREGLVFLIKPARRPDRSYGGN